MRGRHVGVALPSDELRQQHMGVVPAPPHGVDQAARGAEFGHSTSIKSTSTYGSSSGSQPLAQRMVYWYIGVASFPNKDRELLQVLEPLRLVALRIDERQQQEAEAAHSDQLECAGASVASRRCRADAGCPVQGEGEKPLSRANFVRAAPGFGFGRARRPVRPRARKSARRGRPEELNYLAAKNNRLIWTPTSRGRICPHTAGAARLSDGS